MSFILGAATPNVFFFFFLGSSLSVSLSLKVWCPSLLHAFPSLTRSLLDEHSGPVSAAVGRQAKPQISTKI